MKFVRYLPFLLVCFLVACSGEPSKEDLLAEIESFEYRGDPDFRSEFLAERSMLCSTVISLKDGRQVSQEQLDEALISASSCGLIKVAKFLIENGADVNTPSKEYPGCRPLHIAAFDNEMELAKLLIKNGANVNAKDKSGEAPLSLLASHGEEPLKEFAFSMDPKVVGELLDKAHKNNVAIAKLLIENGADVNAKDGYGYTPLMKAASWNNLVLAELLLRKGADVNARNGSITALSIAKERNRTAIVKLLRKYGADE